MGKPKGKTTAYAFFVQEQKDEFQKANPEKKIVFGDFMKECGAKWRELEPEDKVPFEKQAAKDAKRWAREMEDYEPDDEPAKKKKKKKVINLYEHNFKINFYLLNFFLSSGLSQKIILPNVKPPSQFLIFLYYRSYVKSYFSIKDPNAPKRPQTAFFLFSADHRAEAKSQLPEGSRVGDVAKKLGELWADADADTKKKYQDQAEINKAQYEKDMNEYRAQQANGDEDY